MAQIAIHAGGITVEIEDEDSGFKPLARKAERLVNDLIDRLTSLALDDGDDEEDEEVEDG